MSEEDLANLLTEAQSKVNSRRGKRTIKAIGMFDLSGSTPLKFRVGHTLGTQIALLHNLVCKDIVSRSNGSVIKELGDGILVKFDDPVDACLAATQIETATKRIDNCLTKAGLALGSIEEINIDGMEDVLGATVDRCARLQSLAAPGQILVDTALHDAVESFMGDYPHICFSQPKAIRLKGLPEMNVYELSTQQLGFVGWQLPFTLSEEGRLSIQEKVAFMRSADIEVIEVGTALSTFTSYFATRRPAEFKNHVIEMLNRGVNFKCLAMNPNSPIAKIYAADRQEKNLVPKIRSALEELKKHKDEFTAYGLKGSFNIYTYNHFPYFHAVCIDPLTEQGRMTVSHYIHGAPRADNPVMQFSRLLNPVMFNKYLASVQRLLHDSTKL